MDSIAAILFACALAHIFATKFFERLAHNPAAVALFKRGFEDESIEAGGLLLGALLPTTIAAAMCLA